MLVIPLSLLLIILAYKNDAFIRKHNTKLYIVFTIISIAAFFFMEVPVFKPFQQGILALTFYYVVMLTGAIPNKTKLRVQLNKVRMEYSIIGFIVAVPHGLYYINQYLIGEITLPLFGILSLGLMIPLFITSFKVIRKKFTYKSWKQLQSLAYIIYALLFVHLMLNSEGINKIAYIISFSLYFFMKLKYELNIKSQNKKKLVLKSNKD